MMAPNDVRVYRRPPVRVGAEPTNARAVTGVPRSLREPTVAGAAPQSSDRTRQRPAGVPAPYLGARPAATAASVGESVVGSLPGLSSAVDPDLRDRMNRVPLVVLVTAAGPPPPGGAGPRRHARRGHQAGRADPAGRGPGAGPGRDGRAPSGGAPGAPSCPRSPPAPRPATSSPRARRGSTPSPARCSRATPPTAASTPRSAPAWTSSPASAAGRGAAGRQGRQAAGRRRTGGRPSSSRR